METINIINELKASGFDNEQIIDAMNDGQVLKDMDISQEVAEEIVETINK